MIKKINILFIIVILLFTPIQLKAFSFDAMQGLAKNKPSREVLGIKYGNMHIATIPADVKTSIVKLKQMALDKDGVLINANFGTGVWIGKNLILTAAHVVTIEDNFGLVPSIIKVNHTNRDGTTKQIANVRLIAYNKKMDVAVLYAELEEYTNADQSEFENHGETALTPNYYQGQKIIVAGYPIIGGETLTVNEGTITGETEQNNITYLKTDATIGLGSSGSPVFDSNNYIVGLLTKAAADVVAGQTGYMVSAADIIPWINNQTHNVSVPDYNDALKAQRDFQDQWYSQYFSLPANQETNFVLDYSTYPKISIHANSTQWKATGVAINAMYFDYLQNDPQTDLAIRIIKLPFTATTESIKQSNLLQNPNLQFSTETLAGYQAIKFINSGTVYYGIPFRNFIIYINYFSTDTIMTQELKKVIGTIKIDSRPTPSPALLHAFNDTQHNWSISTTDGWYIKTNSNRSSPITIINANNLQHQIFINIQKINESQKEYILM